MDACKSKYTQNIHFSPEELDVIHANVTTRNILEEFVYV